MLLAVDVGNSHTVLGFFEGDVLRHRFRVATDPRRTEDECAVGVRQLLIECGLDWSCLSSAVLASVVPPSTGIWQAMLTEKIDDHPVVVGPGTKTGMAIRYETPRDVGADRIANAVAGFERYGRSSTPPTGVIVVDFGTATTFDVISPRSEYIGGAIAPGMMISADALVQRASKLPRVELVLPDSPIGRTPSTSMQAGILYGYVGLVDGLNERIRASVDFPVKIVATGGVAAVIAAHTATIEDVDDDLTLQGLKIIFERNRG